MSEKIIFTFEWPFSYIHMSPRDISQYIGGGSLEKLLADQSTELGWSLRIKLGMDVAKAMKYLHGRAIMHRDLTSKVRIVPSYFILFFYFTNVLLNFYLFILLFIYLFVKCVNNHK